MVSDVAEQDKFIWLAKFAKNIIKTKLVKNSRNI